MRNVSNKREKTWFYKTRSSLRKGGGWSYLRIWESRVFLLRLAISQNTKGWEDFGKQKVEDVS